MGTGATWQRAGGWWLLEDRSGANPDGGTVFHVLPAVPVVMPNAAGRPAALLQLRLSRPPSPDEASVTPLLVGGHLTVDLGLSLTGQPVVEGTLERRPLFCTSATFRCGDVVAAGRGVTARAALSVPLDRAQALAALAALHGAAPTQAALPLGVAVTYPAASERRRVAITGDAQGVYTALATRLDPSGTGRRFGGEVLEEEVLGLCQDGVLTCEGGDPRPALRGFLRSLPFVRRAGDSEYVLAPDRPPSSPLAYVQTVMTAAEGHFEYGADLGTALAAAFASSSAEGHIQLVAVGPDGLLSPVPTRGVAEGRARGSASSPMVRVGDRAMSAALALRPEAGVLASHLAVAQATQPGVMLGPSVHHLVLDAALLEPVGSRALPRVDDGGAPLWADHTDAARRWYAPEFGVILPQLTDAADASPFAFEFGTSGHDAEGRPGLDATIRLTLEVGMGEATRQVWQAAGQPEARPVQMIGESVQLELPFRDERGQSRTQLFPADELRRDGARVTATFRLMDNWARLAYGALSTPGFQAQPMRVRLSYQFEAYTPAPNRLEWLGFNAATLAVAAGPGEVRGARGPVLDAGDRVLHLPSGALAFTPEPPADSRDVPGLSPAGGYRLVPLPGARVDRSPTLAALAVYPQAVALPVRPELTVNAALLAPFARKYTVTTMARTVTRDVLVPCGALGEFYRQRQEDGTRAIGCQDSFRLGQTEFRQYERLPEFSGPKYSVWRSLQRPGRFLVGPTLFGFTRFGPDEGERAYRPAVYLYSSIDAGNPDNSRCVVMGRLQADLTPFERSALLASLGRLHRTPRLEYLNEIEAHCEVAFALPSGPGARLEVNAVRLWDGFQVTLRSDEDGVPHLRTLLETGALVGSARFTLPDGTEIAADLRLDLRRVVGPWSSGAVGADAGEGGFRLTNRAERAADVRQLSYTSADGLWATVPVGRRLAAGESLAVALPPGATGVLCDYALEEGPASLTEIRSFIEDIHTNVVFLNLVNHARHNLDRLELRARLRGLPEEYRATLADGGTANIGMVLPLTTYLARPTLEFQVTKFTPDGNSTRTPWLAWSLSTLGHVVALSWDLVETDAAP